MRHPRYGLGLSCSLQEASDTGPQFMHGAEPVLFRRSLRTAPRLPWGVSQLGNVGVPKGSDAAFIYRFPGRLPGKPVSPFRVFQSLPGELPPGLVILLFMGFRSATMCVGRDIVQLGAPLMILPMRSMVITC